MTTIRQVAINRRRRESAEYQAKLDHIREQVASGELTIRKASAAQQRRWQQEREQRSR